MSDPSNNGHGLDLETLGAPAAGGTTGPKMLVPLFLVPLLIVAVIVAIFIGVGSVVGTEKTVEDWMNEVETGGVNERWQAAANLTDVALKEPARLDSPALRARLRALFTVDGPEDTRIRNWVAILWSAIGDAEAAPLLVGRIGQVAQVLKATEDRTSPVGQAATTELINHMRALSKVGNGTEEEAAAVLLTVKDGDVGIRTAAAAALGSIGRKAIVSGGAPADAWVAALLELNRDGDAWVAMNAALALAKCGRAEGLPTLETMVDRAWLKSQRLSFPDDGHYSVDSFDPAASPIASALIAIESIWSLKQVEAARVASLRAAVAVAANDQNPAIQARAKALLAKLDG